MYWRHVWFGFPWLGRRFRLGGLRFGGLQFSIRPWLTAHLANYTAYIGYGVRSTKVGLELFGAFVFGQGDEHPLKRAIFSACVCALLYSRSAARYSGVRLAGMVRLLWATA